MIRNKLIATASLLTMLPMASSAALITWNSSVDLFPGSTVDTFVNTTGTSVLAINADNATDGSTSITLNGVQFVESNLANLSSVTGLGGVTLSTTVVGQTGNSFGDGGFTSNGDIFNVIASGFFGAGDVSFNNLTDGYTYEIQLFTNDARADRDQDWATGVSNGVDPLTFANASFSSLSNRSPIDGLGEASGDSITGTFVADGTAQSFSINGTDNGTSFNAGGRAQINAIQLRLIAVPEPSTTALLGLGGLALILRRRK